VTAQAGIKFVHNSGRAGKKFCRRRWARAWRGSMPTATAGRPPADQQQGLDAARPQVPAALYRNNHDGTFTDITAGSGLDVEMYGMGVAIGDYDNDGRDDVYITALEGDHLFHNEGHGKFRDVTKAAGIDNANFGASAAWLDYDRDGKLDLFVANYVQWTPKRAICGARSMERLSRTARRNLTKGLVEAVSQLGQRQVRRCH
jgi:hypothetical protein